MSTQIFFQRNRKTLTRAGMLLLAGLSGLLLALPRADAHGPRRAPAAGAVGTVAVLLAPEPISGARFSTFYPLTHR